MGAVSCLGGRTGSKGMGVQGHHQVGSNQHPSCPPQPGARGQARGPLTCPPGLGACVPRARLPALPRDWVWAALSTNSHQTRMGAFSPPTCLMLTQLSPLPPPSSCWEGGPGTWEPSSWALWPQAAVPPVLQVRAWGPGPLGLRAPAARRFLPLVPATSSFLSTKHLLIFTALTTPLAQVGVDRPGCWSL